MEQKKIQYVITDDLRDRILNAVDIVQLVSQDIKLKKLSANNFAACCPFHTEATPSFTVSSAKGFYHCFGCGAHGNSISWAMEYKGMDYVEAIVHLAAIGNLEVPTITLAEQQNFASFVEFNKWFVSEIRKHTKKDMSPLIDLLQKMLAVRNKHDEGEDESYVNDLVTIKPFELAASEVFGEIKSTSEMAGLLKMYSGLSRQTYGHFVRDDRGFVSGLCVYDQDNKKGYNYIPLPLGKRLNNSLLGIEQIKIGFPSENHFQKPHVFIYCSPEDYFCDRMLSKDKLCLSHPTGAKYLSEEQLNAATRLSKNVFGTSLFYGGIYIQLAGEHPGALISALRTLHADQNAMEKNGVFIKKDIAPKELKTVEHLSDGKWSVSSLSDYMIFLGKNELNYPDSGALSAKQRFALVMKINELLDLPPDSLTISQYYSELLGLNPEVVTNSLVMSASPTVKTLVARSIQDLCFSIMCNRPRKAVELHSEIESYMHLASLPEDNQDKQGQIYSDLDVGSIIGQIFIASSVCSSVMESDTGGESKLVAIAKQMELDIGNDFAVRFINLGKKHRAVVNQLPDECSPVTLIRNSSHLIDTFVQRMSILTPYERYVILDAMENEELPMSSFAGLTLEAVAQEISQTANTPSE